MRQRSEKRESDRWLLLIVGVPCGFLLLWVLMDYPPTRNWLCEGYEAGESCGRGLLVEFQTLITGLAAVVAATWTIRTMTITDERQDLRHGEMVALSLRNEYGCLDRLLVTHAENLKGNAVLVVQLYEQIMSAEYEVQAVWAEIFAIETVICGTADALASQEFEDASRFLDGEMNRATRALRQVCEQGAYSARRAAEQYRYSNEPDPEFDFWFTETGHAWSSGSETIIRCLGDLGAPLAEVGQAMKRLETRVARLRALYPSLTDA